MTPASVFLLALTIIMKRILLPPEPCRVEFQIYVEQRMVRSTSRTKIFSERRFVLPQRTRSAERRDLLIRKPENIAEDNPGIGTEFRAQSFDRGQQGAGIVGAT